jgi:hypothetical protein
MGSDAIDAETYQEMRARSSYSIRHTYTHSVPHGMLVKRATLLLDIVDRRVASVDVPAVIKWDKQKHVRRVFQTDTTASALEVSRYA